MNKKGFTLIELLAVIIILGVLMIIAIPSVTKYIDDSRKNGYVSTAKELAGGARNLIHSGSLNLDDFDTTYYIDAKCISTDNAYKSPYGEFEKAYVVVTASNDNYEYFWTSVDSTGTGVKNLININKLDNDNIETDIDQSEITTDRGLDNREYVVVVNSDCQKGPSTNRTGPKINSETGDATFLCKKATTLHTKKCKRTSDGCGVDIGNGNDITYGTIPNGTPKAGDAYDCDVNNDGVYDSLTERFYYITNEGNNSILIYYKNITNQSEYAYDSSNENWHGPRTGYQYLPNTSVWNNPGIIAPGTRQIVAQNGLARTSGGAIESFTYTDKAARFITTDEIRTACNISVSNLNRYDSLNNCNYLLESVGYYEEYGCRGYWTETPYFDNSNYYWFVVGNSRTVPYGSGGTSGIRPVITIRTSNIE